MNLFAAKEYKKYTDLLEANRNLVLTGAPGTGKTHTAKEIAWAFLELKAAEYRELCGISPFLDELYPWDKQIVNDVDSPVKMVQFHPSYDYSDFVEGLRPVKGSGNQIEFARLDGVFKAFCKGARQGICWWKKKDDVNNVTLKKLCYGIDCLYESCYESIANTIRQDDDGDDWILRAFLFDEHLPQTAKERLSFVSVDRTVYENETFEDGFVDGETKWADCLDFSRTLFCKLFQSIDDEFPTEEKIQNEVTNLWPDVPESPFKRRNGDFDKFPSAILLSREERLLTGNIMGFIGYRNTQVSIRSRFTQNDSHDYFLHYMLQRVFAINLFDLKFGSDNEAVFDFLIYLFPSFLKRAMRQGVYKEYQTRNYNDVNVKGRIDVARHIRLNIPFTGKIAYTTREYSTDNHVTQLIRHTIDYIAGHPQSDNILYKDEEARDAVNRILLATPTYNRNNLQSVINSNLHPLNHPYFLEFRNLQRLCLQILRNEEIKYGHDDSNQIYGILYDGAWLWEEYVNTVLKEMGFKHPRNKTGEGGMRIFADKIGYERAMPDYHRPDMVLDAKYKRYISWKDISRDDRNQLLSYMFLYKVGSSGFIVPIEHPNTISTRPLNGSGGTMSLMGMNVVTNCNSFKEYCSYMAKEEKLLKEKIEQISRG